MRVEPGSVREKGPLRMQRNSQVPETTIHNPAAGGSVLQSTLRDEALELVDGERARAYGPPVIHWEKVAACWSAILGTEVTAHRAALCMAAMKLVRDAHRADPENRLDCHGYLDIAGRCADA